MLARRDVFPKYWRCCQHLNGTSEQPGCSFGSLALVRLRAHARLALAGPALAGAAGHAEGACGPAPAVHEDLVDARLVGQALFDDELGLADGGCVDAVADVRSEEHTSELQSLMRISYAVFCLKKKTTMIKKTK